jgi:hypothetical protein
MNLSEFNDAQCQALIELFVLGMYCDSHLASAEDAEIKKIAKQVKFSSDYQRDLFVDGIFTRASRVPRTADALRAHIEGLKPSFKTPDARRKACDAVEQFLASDSEVTAEEREFLAGLRAAFEVKA